ncbi:MAG: hypothetical protein LC804_10455 [Acidobacteria bacterium]|nr:hypothetical protein [Acidobacteriota bacterium]
MLPAAEVHARRAVETDPTVSLGCHALAHIQVHWRRNWAAAEANYRRALALDPKDENPQCLVFFTTDTDSSRCSPRFTSAAIRHVETLWHRFRAPQGAGAAVAQALIRLPR